MKNVVPAPVVSRKWTAAASTSKFQGDLPQLRSFVHAGSKKEESRYRFLRSREGLLQDPQAALCTAVWLLNDYTETGTKYRLLQESRVALCGFLKQLAAEINTADVHELVSRLVEKSPVSRRSRTASRVLDSIRPAAPAQQ